MRSTRRVLVPCLAAFCLAGGAGAASAADKLIHGAIAYTPTADGVERFSAMLIRGDRVEAIGGEDLLARYPEAERIDAGGLTLLPGLIDAHGHVSSLGLTLAGLDLADIRSLEETLEATEGFARSRPTTAWIRGRGWNQVLWPGKQFPSASDLDRAVSDRPAYLTRIDGHAAWVNTRALAAAGIDRDTPDPPGGKIHRDVEGEPTGILIDAAMDLVESKIPPPDQAELREALSEATQTLAAAGLTGVHDAGISLAELAAYRSLIQDGAMPIRVYAMLGGMEVFRAFDGPPAVYGDDRLTVASVKLYADGALGSRGAALLEPYADDPGNEGLLFRDATEFRAAIAEVNGAGFQACIHAIGDRANRVVLDAFEAVQRGAPSPLRNRIEHAQVVALEDIPRFAELGVIASMQQTHATSDMNMAEDRVGPKRILGAYAWRRLLDSGALIAGGSDFPVEKWNPFLGLYAAVSRKDTDGRPEQGWYRDQAMSREEALRSFTLDAAYAGGQERELGSLEPGKYADFILVDRDFFAVPEDALFGTEVLQTWVAGRPVFVRE